MNTLGRRTRNKDLFELVESPAIAGPGPTGFRALDEAPDYMNGGTSEKPLLETAAKQAEDDVKGKGNDDEEHMDEENQEMSKY